MILKTEAVPLRIVPYSRTSQVVFWLTPREGRVATAIKGACRPKSGFLGQYDLFQTCELLYYEREHDGMHVARECAVLKPRSSLRTRWRAAACASYVTDLAWQTCQSGPHHEAIFALLEAALDALSEQAACLPILFWFELRLTHLLGVAPQFDRCAACGAAGPGPAWRCFSPVKGGLVCPACVRKGAAKDGLAVNPGVIAIARGWQDEDLPGMATRTRCTPAQTRDLGRILERFLQYHLDIDLRSRYIALDMAGLDPRAAYGETG